MQKKLFGLIGHPLTHSFSKKYFTEKFSTQQIENCQYELFDIPEIEQITQIFAKKNLYGLNVTIPYKKQVINYLDELHPSAQRIGAVNVIQLKAGKKIGYNSDYFGFRQSLERFLGEKTVITALILGNGGAAKAVAVALNDLQIPFCSVTRQANQADLCYEDLDATIIEKHQLIINTTPLGTFPNVETCPDIPYQYLSNQHFLYDLVYNPAETTFMQKGIARGAKTCNGLEMLVLQAEKAWEIWSE